MNIKTKNMVLTAVMTAMICVLAPISVPVGPVPISLATLVIFIAVYVLGMKQALAAVLLYLLLGLVGLPVFSGYSAGPAKLLGPTGGYLIGYIPMVAIAGIIIDKHYNNRIISAAGMTAATAALYFCGTAWLAFSADMGFGAAIMAGVVPFIPTDLAKIAVTAIAGPVIKLRLEKAGLALPSA